MPFILQTFHLGNKLVTIIPRFVLRIVETLSGLAVLSAVILSLTISVAVLVSVSLLLVEGSCIPLRH